jgi:hypothetical protein
VDLVAGASVLGSVSPSYRAREGFGSIARISAGVVELTLVNTIARERCTVMATPTEGGALSITSGVVLSGTNVTKVRVETQQDTGSGGAPADVDFDVLIVGLAS